VAQKFHFAVLRIEVTHASRGLSAIAELLVIALWLVVSCSVPGSCHVVDFPHSQS